MGESKDCSTGSQRTVRSAALVALGFAALVATGAGAQTNDEIGAAMELDFSPPGARSLSLAHAFVALADDATAAYANPAGLLQLHRDEASLELRASRRSTRFVDGGSASGSPTGDASTVADGSNVDAFAGLRSGGTASDALGLSFLSYAHPEHDWAIAGFRHELARYRARIERSAGFFYDGSGAGGQIVRRRSVPLDAELALDVASVGASLAYRLADNLWVGVSLARATLRLDATTHRFSGRNLEGGTLLTDRPEDFGADREFDRHEQKGDDQTLATSFGVLWRSAGGAVRVGGVWRPGPEFDFDYRFEFGAAAVADGTAGRPDEQLEALRRSGRGRFAVPDFAGLGVVVQPRIDWILAAQFNRVRYSSLATRYNLLKDVRFPAGEPLGCCGSTPLPDEGYSAGVDSLRNFRIDDADEIHLGAEWATASRSGVGLALRGGAWYEGDHRLRYVGADRIQASRFPGGSGRWHATAGLGLTRSLASPAAARRFGPTSFSVDVGADLSPRSRLGSVSGVLRF